MKHYILLFMTCLLSISACTPIKLPVTNEYTLTLPAHTPHSRTKFSDTLFISKPEAMAGYRTEQMLYMKRPFSLEPFAQNAWSSPPAEMLYPLLVQHIQSSQAFRAITSSPYADKADYRLDTQLLTCHQNFLSQQSAFEFTAKIALTRVADNRVMASQLISQRIPCSANTPYAGVVAANRAAHLFVEKTLDFVIRQVQNDKGSQNT